MKQAVLVCAALLTINLLLLDNGSKLVLLYENSNKRSFLITVGKGK